MRLNENEEITSPEVIRQHADMRRRQIHALIAEVSGSANAHLDLGTDDILDMTRARSERSADLMRERLIHA